ncbi:hypothetical protein [Phaeacidiphilus oryzae]|uniref:hypothetical protein n=1 Tax=Phaeacidiphilus oryzae TaxID=348818 RepID=UPI00056C6EA9|nr:hypothetical protein [Phaeacidiphilus oryzae]
MSAFSYQVPESAGAAVEPLRRVELEFQCLAARPEPLTVKIGHLHAGLPQEEVDVVTLRSLLLHPSLGYPARTAIWRHLSELAGGEGPEAESWRLACLGMVGWGLRRVAARVCRMLPGHNLDLQQVIIEAAWSALAVARQAPPEEAGRIPARVVWAADRAARTYREREAVLAARQAELADAPAEARRQPIHPDALLSLAVRQGVIGARDAALVGDYRLGGVSTRTLAEQAGMSPQAIDKRRRRAEARLASAITSGALAFTEVEHLIEG